MPEKTDDKITQLNPQHYLFIPDHPDLNPRFKFRLWYRAQVEAGQAWQIYRDGVLHDKWNSGPHTLWNSFFINGKQYTLICVLFISTSLVMVA